MSDEQNTSVTEQLSEVATTVSDGCVLVRSVHGSPPMVMGSLSHKLNATKAAGRSYVDDRVTQTEQKLISFAVAAGLFAAAVIFLVAALILGTVALFSWIELRYGALYGFAAIAALLALISITCLVIGTYQREKPAKRVIPLATRLRVAVTASPLSEQQLD